MHLFVNLSDDVLEHVQQWILNKSIINIHKNNIFYTLRRQTLTEKVEHCNLDVLDRVSLKFILDIIYRDVTQSQLTHSTFST